ncbi:MAG: hypothetical protein VW687_13170 [Curvibacter sp.]
MRRLFALGLLALLSACAQSPKTAQAPASSPQTAAEDRGSKAQTLVQDSGVIQTATQPLNDLNLIQTAIPPVLTRAQLGGAYAPPADSACAALQAELLALDAALGPDIDAAGTPDAEPGLMGKAVDFVGDAAMDSVRGTVNAVVDGVIPLRSWVRKLSGAERHSRAVAAAIAAGTLRRPYLKGWAWAQGCIEGPWPAPARTVP